MGLKLKYAGTVKATVVKCRGHGSAANFVDTVLKNTSSALPTFTKSFGGNCFRRETCCAKANINPLSENDEFGSRISLCGPSCGVKKTRLDNGLAKRGQGSMWFPRAPPRPVTG